MQEFKMRVKTICCNKDSPSQYYVLAYVDEEGVLPTPYCPNNWSTQKGAIRWAIRNGLEVVESECE